MIKLLRDNVLILPDEAEELTKGGIIIPNTAKEKPIRGKVIAVGPGIKDEPMELKEGDVVLYSKYGGSDITLEKIEYKLMHQTDVFCVL